MRFLMRLMGVGVLVMSLASAGGAMTLSVDSSAQWVLFSLPNLNQYVRLANQTLGFVNERATGDPVPFLPELRSGVGLRLTQTLGSWWRIGLQLAMASAGTRTQGSWDAGETSHAVDLALEASLVALGVETRVVLVPEVLSLSASVGWGFSRVAHRCAFPRTLPTDWSLPFLPRNEDAVYTASGPVGALAMGLSLPLGRGFSVGLEGGFRFAPPRIPRSGTAVLDLNADGLGDPVGFTGLWLGVAVRVELNL